MIARMSFARSDEIHVGGGWSFSRNEDESFLDGRDGLDGCVSIDGRKDNHGVLCRRQSFLEVCVIMRTGFLIKDWLQGILACLPLSVRFSLPFLVRWKLIRRWSFPQDRDPRLCLFFNVVRNDWLLLEEFLSWMTMDRGYFERSECLECLLLCDDVECFLFETNKSNTSRSFASFSTVFQNVQNISHVFLLDTILKPQESPQDRILMRKQT